MILLRYQRIISHAILNAVFRADLWNVAVESERTFMPNWLLYSFILELYTPSQSLFDCGRLARYFGYILRLEIDRGDVSLEILDSHQLYHHPRMMNLCCARMIPLVWHTSLLP